MSFRLSGPRPLDLRDPQASIRRELRAIVEGPAAGGLEPAASTGEPGLYLLWEDGGPAAARLAGFWVVVPEASAGDAGLPGDAGDVPLAAACFGAATEAVWWRDLPVRSLRDGVWEPLLVLEWGPALAERAVPPPPGVTPRAPPPAARGRAGSDEEGWWDAEEPAQPSIVSPVEEPPSALRAAPTPALDPRVPERRSFVAAVRGSLRVEGGLHTGAWQLLAPPALVPVDGEALVAFDAWLEALASAPPLRADADTTDDRAAAPARVGASPLALPGGRAAHALGGWLNAALQLSPARLADLNPGRMLDRDIASLWRSQGRTATGVTLAAMLAVLLLAALVVRAARPDVPAPGSVRLDRAQQALSVCSADNEAFLEEFRCQIRHFAEGGGAFTPACGDDASVMPGAVSWQPPVRWADHRPEWCGLVDRRLDGWKTSGAEGWDFAALAASKACFNVLGRPHDYRAPDGMPRFLPDPTRMLEDPSMRVEPLVALVAQLEGRCNDALVEIERQVEGAILATHVGTADLGGEGGALRQLAMERAADRFSRSERACFEAGTRVGADAPRDHDALCAPDGRSQPDLGLDPGDPWARLASGAPPETPVTPVGVVPRYVDARFGVRVGARDPMDDARWPAPRARAAAAPGLWRCHLGLAGEVEWRSVGPTARVDGAWSRAVPVPTRYDIGGGSGAMQQLDLDATLTALAAGGDAGRCWRVVSERLATYLPVHPLLPKQAVAGWPSAEQQLCGQVCAVRYRLRSTPRSTPWVTPESDLVACTSPGEPLGTDATPPGWMHQLRLPWNNVDGRWVAPSVTSICAFHLVAQSYFSEGDASVIADGAAPVEWAGQSGPGLVLGGDRDAALAVVGARALSSYGRARSTHTCGHVATQCFVTGLLAVAGGSGEVSGWRSRWASWVGRMAGGQAGRMEETNPWCRLVQPYLRADGSLPEGQLDFPCARGVADTRTAVEAALFGLGARAEASAAGGDE